MASILIADDQDNFRFSLSVALKRDGYEVLEASTGAQAARILASKDVDIVVTDLRMPGMDGLALLEEVRKIRPSVEMVVMTAFGSVDSAVEAMKRGACDYITKPFQPDELAAVIKRTLDRMHLARRVRDLEGILVGSNGHGEMIGASAAIREIHDLIESISGSEGAVLITGESGTGKELVAKAIHKSSPRKDRAFVAVNCAALPDTLQESEMFGYSKGAFTGAFKNKSGLIEEANGGTLFLDEIALASPAMQSKLLRFLQSGEFRRLGETQEHHVDVRLIAATNSDLAAATRNGQFRQDLYYRINVIPIHVPALRERMEDVPLLAEHFLKRFARSSTKAVEGFDESALESLATYDWPGNVRELENAVEYAVTIAKGRILGEDALPPQVRKRREAPQRAAMTLEDAEARHILSVLESTGWNQDHAAAVLCIGRTTLWRKLKTYGIAPKRRRGRTGRWVTGS